MENIEKKPQTLKKQEIKRIKSKQAIDIEYESLSKNLRQTFLKNNVKGKTEADDELFDEKMQELIMSFDKCKHKIENFEERNIENLSVRSNSVMFQSEQEFQIEEVKHN